MNLFRRKTVASLQAEALNDQRLRRALGPLNLTTLGIGAIIGAGIFVLTGQAAAKYAGPAIVFSFVLAGVACALAGLCYAEFAAMIPISGSAYTYGYATLGELRGLDHRLGPDPGVSLRRLDRGGGLVGLRGLAALRSPHSHSARVVRGLWHAPD